MADISKSRIDVRELPEKTLVALTGEFDYEHEPLVSRTLELVARRAPELIEIDLRGARSLDTTVLGAILTAHLRAEAEGRRVVVLRGPERVHSLFRTTGLDHRLAIVQPNEATPALVAY